MTMDSALPRLVRADGLTHFEVDGAPFFPLGAQVHNSSAYTREALEAVWEHFHRLHANTAEVPVYWEQVEPREGCFDFGVVDALLAGAREHGLRLVLLWFASWKNGTMSYCPEWVKRDADRFQRVLGADGVPVNSMSPHCAAARESDRAAYCALLTHLRGADTDHRVIAVQIENEPGTMGAARDHRPVAEEFFRSEVPAEVRALAGRGGSWPEAFGAHVDEMFNAYHVARYIETIAAAGKAIYPLPTVVNAWLGEIGWRVPGISYPSGGPTSTTLDLWKAVTPSVDVIAPDIYSPSERLFRRVCETYRRPDNPLFIPETPFAPWTARNVFRAIAEYDAMGFAAFGIDSCFDAAGVPTPRAAALVDSYAVIRVMLPLVLRYRGTGRLRALVQEEGERELYVPLEGAVALVAFDEGDDPRDRGRGLLVQAGPNEFYVGGVGLRVTLARDVQGEARRFRPLELEGLLTPYLLVEEGHLAGGEWLPVSRWNGDESSAGLRARTPERIVRAVLE